MRIHAGQLQDAGCDRGTAPKTGGHPDGHLGVYRAGACLGSVVEPLGVVVVESVHIELEVVAEKGLG
jgi:hypothetical protein